MKKIKEQEHAQVSVCVVCVCIVYYVVHIYALRLPTLLLFTFKSCLLLSIQQQLLNCACAPSFPYKYCFHSPALISTKTIFPFHPSNTNQVFISPFSSSTMGRKSHLVRKLENKPRSKKAHKLSNVNDEKANSLSSFICSGRSSIYLQ